MKEPLHLTALLAYEFRQSLRFQVWRRAAKPREGVALPDAQADLNQFDADLANGPRCRAATTWRTSKLRRLGNCVPRGKRLSAMKHVLAAAERLKVSDRCDRTLINLARFGLLVEYNFVMKNISALVSLLLLAVSAQLLAGEADKSRPASAELDRMKALAGTWRGKTDMGQGPMEFTVEYRVVSGGNAVEERIFAGTPKEMVTMYYDDQGKLCLTHYCMLGNRPGMRLKTADAKTLNFDFDPKCGVKARSEMHMHALAITFEDADTILQDWKMYEGGNERASHPFTLKRVKL